MCFSAEASFASGALLMAVGAYSVSLVKRPAAIPFAAVPFFFGVQQVAEGAVWVFGKTESVGCTVATNSFLFFAYAWWPLYFALAVYLFERADLRKKVLLPFVAVGALTSAYFLAHILTSRYVPHLGERGIGYWGASPSPYISIPYYLATCVAAFVSSSRIVNLFGVAVGAAAYIASAFYVGSFLSTWCFFSALLSILIVWAVRTERLAKPAKQKKRTGN